MMKKICRLLFAGFLAAAVFSSCTAGSGTSGSSASNSETASAVLKGMSDVMQAEGIAFDAYMSPVSTAGARLI